MTPRLSRQSQDGLQVKAIAQSYRGVARTWFSDTLSNVRLKPAHKALKDG